MTGGMDNPVDVVFTPGGERIFTTTFLQHPGDGKRDGLIHAIYGGVYGKVHDVIEGHPRTGPEVMPVARSPRPRRSRGLGLLSSREGFGPSIGRDALRLQLQHAARSRGTSSTPEGATFTPRLTISSSRPIATSIRPTSSKTPTAACSWSIPAAGTSSAARPRSSPSRTCWGRFIESGTRAKPRIKTREERRSGGTRFLKTS